MASTSSSSQQNAFSGIEPPNKRRKVEQSSRLFDVFINHRGPDVKLTLATQLYNSLKDLQIKAFLDSEEKELGDSFPSTIETAIRSASVHIAIFSKSYAESAWCLAELVLMLQSKAKIIPLFYQVEPWELRYIEKGVYAEAFLQHVEKGRYLDKIEEWKKALQQVSYTAGYEYKNSDSSDCREILSAVEKEVNRTKLLHVAKYPVGLHKLVKDFEIQCLNELVQDFESQCGMKKAAKEKVNIVGIFGMGGVGKTTLSKELFNLKRSIYTKASFLFDVREAHARGNLFSLQSKLLKDIFGEDHSFQSSEEGTSCLRDHLERSASFSVLIVLDDIDHVEQLDALLVMDILNKSDDNLVIITTRDVGVLVSAGIDVGYHLKGLDREGGRELFCWYAFKQPLPLVGYEDLVQDFVNMCGGLPLSIVVLGRHVFGRARWYWQSELEKFKDSLPGDIKRRLKISIDTLDNVEKQIFMDIACFFIGRSFTMAMTIWKGCGWRARHALERLKEKCLIEEVKDRWCYQDWEWESTDVRVFLGMHDHLRDLGREMANELSHPPRVWHPQHLKSLELKGFRNILAQTKGRCFHSIFDESMGCQVTYFLGESEDGSDTSLLLLRLDYKSVRPLRLNSDINSSIFSWIPLQNLQCLGIRNGCFGTLWQSDVQAPSNLRELQIRNTFLEENIVVPTRTISVRNCRDLLAGDLTKLTRLTIVDCPALEELPNAARVSCLEEIQIKSCEKLQNMPGVGELHTPIHMNFCYCSNTLIRKCIQKLKSVPSRSLSVVGRAADGAESSLNRNLFCEGNIGVDAVIEIGTGTSLECPEVSSIIGCFVVVIDSSTSLQDLNRSLLYHGIKLREGEWIITWVESLLYYGEETNIFLNSRVYDCEEFERVLKRYGVMKKGFWVKIRKGEEWKCVSVLSIICDRLLHSFMNKV